MVYEIDGTRFSNLEEFFAEFSRVVIPEKSPPLSRSLDAFNDVLRGGFGTPNEGFTIRWMHHDVSKQRLGYAETARQLELRLARCHPTNRNEVAYQLAEAQATQGPTVFDWIVEIIRDHGPGGSEEQDRVELLLD